MIELYNENRNAVSIRYWWTNFIYWFPTIQTELHLLNGDSCLTNLSIETEFYGEGNNFAINLYWLGFVVNIDFWWNLNKRT